MKTDTVVAATMLLIAVVFLVQRKVGYLAVWLLLITVVIGYGVKMPLTGAVVLGVGTVAAVVYISGETLKETYENPSKKKSSSSEEESDSESSKEKKKTKSSAPEPSGGEHHLDAGTTILHAFQKLNPEQVLQMRDDTKELMETQKQLVETLSSLGPQVQQGADLVESFKHMFSGNLPEVLSQ
jgi:energy-coupling factor transporter transmembrane protein EcfT